MRRIDIETGRLTLRAFTSGDASIVQRLAGNKKVSNVTANIPHPYPDGLAAKWIAAHEGMFHTKGALLYAIALKENDELIGCINIIGIHSEKPEIGYWIGFDFWGHGYCTEALKALIKFCRNEYDIPAIYGRHLTRNPSSGRVMEKCGLSLVSQSIVKTGLMPQHEELKEYARFF
ncbi:GNAT family N-acetyltransferase [Marinomonas sp.]|nr:GNAT family N-acetyltransferase [Marinomonas sp.]MDB4837712.1 GNAT family N-acetyltransferase [Marinomonas sp.]